MTKAQPKRVSPTDVDPQDWLARILRDHFDAILANRDAALDPVQTEGVHETRIEIRRVRSAIRDSAHISERSPLQGVRKALKKLANRLGAVRDRDVFISAIEKRSAKTNDAKILEGLTAILTPERQKRAAAFARLEKKFSDKFAADLKDRFESALDASFRQRDLFQATNLREAGGQTISACTDEFLRLTGAFYDPFAVKRLHRLRIRGKRLRYALELFQEPFGIELNAYAEQTREMQSHLGDVHDCDLWMADLQRRIKHNKDSSPEHQAAAWLLSQFLRRRAKAQASALDLWSKWEKHAFTDNLKTLISK